MAQRSHSKYSGFFLYAISSMIEKRANPDKQIFYIACVLTGATNHWLVFFTKSFLQWSLYFLDMSHRWYQMYQDALEKWAALQKVGTHCRGWGYGKGRGGVKENPNAFWRSLALFISANVWVCVHVLVLFGFITCRFVRPPSQSRYRTVPSRRFRVLPFGSHIHLLPSAHHSWQPLLFSISIICHFKNIIWMDSYSS